jgi:molybdenum cofactor cytidylyltransferase
MLAAVILAAGESRRMGSPKALLPYQGRPFLEHLIEITRHPKVSVRRVVLGAGADEIRTQLALDPETVIINPDWEAGQLTSIQAAVRSLPEDTDGMLLLLVDHPLISAGLVAELIAKFYASGKAIVLPAYERKRGHPVIFSRGVYAELLAAPAEKGARAVVWAHTDDLLEVPTDEEGVILNLNDPEALRKALGE